MKKLVVSTALSLSLLTAGIAGTTQEASAATKYKVIKIQKGDSLSELAVKYKLNLSALLKANPSLAKKGVKPKTNQTVKVPTTTAKPASSTPTTSKPATPAPTAPVATGLSAFEKEVVTLVNAERAKAGLKALAVDQELSKVARLKSEDMQKRGEMSHTGTYGSPFDMMKKFGISYKSAGENIAKGQTTPAAVMKAWMNSSGHKANILNKNYTHIGVGYVKEGNYWTQQFIQK